MINNCELKEQVLHYNKEAFPIVVEQFLCAYPDALVHIHYYSTTRTTKNLEIVLKQLDNKFVTHLTIEIAGTVIQMQRTQATVISGENLLEQWWLTRRILSPSGAGCELIEEGYAVNTLLKAAGKVLQFARVYFDNGEELNYLPIESLDNITDNAYEVYVEGTYNNRPARVGVSEDGYFYIEARNNALSEQIRDKVRELL